jgi:tryptophan-rich sensory protein
MSISITRTPLQRPSAWRAGFVLVPLLLALGGLSARFSGSTEDNAWYQTLTLPALQPPGPVFGIAWSILYTLIAVSAALVWGHKRGPGRTLALKLFGIGVLINLAWSPTKQTRIRLGLESAFGADFDPSLTASAGLELGL